MYPSAKYIKLEHPWYDHFGEILPSEKAREVLKLEQNRKTLLFFGLIRDYKGLDILLKAFSNLDDTYQLVIAGEIYGKADKYLSLIENSKNKNIYLFNQYIPDDEVNLYFSAADLCVLPYRSATQSGITGTSFQFNVPVLATNVGGLNEAIKNGKLGDLVEPENPESMYLKIQEVFNTNNLEIFKKNIQIEKNNNNWDEFAQKLMAFASTI
jgi:glycosyltransferase involved in cell wall biosynthesis